MSLPQYGTVVLDTVLHLSIICELCLQYRCTVCSKVSLIVVSSTVATELVLCSMLGVCWKREYPPYQMVTSHQCTVITCTCVTVLLVWGFM